MSAITRADSQRRQGTLGEIDTVRERLESAEKTLTKRQLLVWRRILWWVEQQYQQAERMPACAGSPLARVVAGLDRDLAEMDALVTEARAEIAGALRHLDNVVPAVRIDQYLADRMRLQDAGLDDSLLDAFVNGERSLERAS